MARVERAAGVQFGQIDAGVLVDVQGAVGAVGRGRRPPLVLLAGGVERLLFVAGRQSGSLGQQPNLVQVDRLGRRRVELAVANAGAGGHPLEFAGPQRLRRCPGCRGAQGCPDST